ncbi:hypothetical protein DESUT3_03210 [Desulfuromonas versatilis]|uniref:Phosphate-selective porin O and P n=1 Tax=Desulfuromonas versatilis TaxID=2802975 RepID=A0ABN6DSV9_9BACT|nr:porin [Desulfuromonas versatilis]BCR03252.1 hypothetical protein DESUT3_03210 [Desulfuromonas versatilis]
MKKLSLTLTAALAALLLAATGQAKTLEDILKEKGVITAEEYAEANKNKSLVSYQPGKGIVAESADGNYRAQIGGYAQLLYTFTDFDSQAKDDTSDFNIRRFKLQLQGNLVSKKFGYKFQGDMKNGFTTEDAFINYEFAAPFTLQFGQFKPAQARQELTSASRQLFPERSLANDTFNLGRDLGIEASGDIAGKLLEYRVGLFSGNGPNTSNPDNHHMLAGRLDFNPLGEYKMDEAGWPSDKPKLNLGVSSAWSKISEADVAGNFNRDNDVMDVALNLDGLTAANFTTSFGNDLTWLLWTTNLNATWMGISFASEYYHLNADPDLGDDWNADGYYVQAGYQLIPSKLELGVRYSAIESDDSTASAKFDKSQIQGGVNYYFVKHNAKLQADFTHVDDDLVADNDDNIFRLQAQFSY